MFVCSGEGVETRQDKLQTQADRGYSPGPLLCRQAKQRQPGLQQHVLSRQK